VSKTDVHAEPASGTAAPSRLAVVMPWISVLARLVLGGVLVVAAIAKLSQSPAEQVRAVRAYQLLPHGVDAAVAYTLPFVELVLAIALIVGVATRIAAVASGVLMLAFVIGVASVWARGLSIDCGCFGGGGPVEPGETRYLEEILRDIGLMVAAGWLAVVGPGRFALSSAMSRPSSSGEDLDRGEE
jgi:uncharacterized membrane protein YphA (DoxX/SURF4 family)